MLQMNDDLKTISWPGWKTVRVIGKGSYGKVYEIQRDLNGMVEKAALKVITIPQGAEETKELLNSGHSMQSIEKYYSESINDIISEYQIMAKMKGQSNVVSCDDYKVVRHNNDRKCDILIKMELLTPLNSYIQHNGMTESDIIKLAKDMCHALILCAEDSIIHRDIKPQNIFRSNHGDYKLGDFGIAKAVDRTTSGTIIGTYKYMAPEVYFGKPYGAQADMYSLGLVLYWLLNNRVGPFLSTRTEIPSATQELEARRLRLEGNRLPRPSNGSDALAEIVLKASEYEPSDRFSDAYEMLKELEKIEYEETTISDDYFKENINDARTVIIKADPSNSGDSYREKNDLEKARKKRKKIIMVAAISVSVLILLLFLLLNPFSDKEDIEEEPTPTLSPETTEIVEEGIAKGKYEGDTYVNSSLNLSIQKPDGYVYIGSQEMAARINENSSVYGVQDEIKDDGLYEFAFVSDAGGCFIGFTEPIMYREQSPTSYLQSLKQISKGQCSEISKTTFGNGNYYSMTITTETDKAVFYVIRKDDDLFIMAITGSSDEIIDQCVNQINK